MFVVFFVPLCTGALHRRPSKSCNKSAGLLLKGLGSAFVKCWRNGIWNSLETRWFEFWMDLNGFELFKRPLSRSQKLSITWVISRRPEQDKARFASSLSFPDLHSFIRLPWSNICPLEWSSTPCTEPMANSTPPRLPASRPRRRRRKLLCLGFHRRFQTAWNGSVTDPKSCAKWLTHPRNVRFLCKHLVSKDCVALLRVWI